MESHDIDLRRLGEKTRSNHIGRILNILHADGINKGYCSANINNALFIIVLPNSKEYMFSGHDDWSDVIAPRNFLRLYEPQGLIPPTEHKSYSAEQMGSPQAAPTPQISNCKMKFDGVDDPRIEQVAEILELNGYGTNTCTIDNLVIYTNSMHYKSFGVEAFKTHVYPEFDPNYFIALHGDYAPFSAQSREMRDAQTNKGFTASEYLPQPDVNLDFNIGDVVMLIDGAPSVDTQHADVKINLTEYLPGYNMGRLP